MAEPMSEGSEGISAVEDKKANGPEEENSKEITGQYKPSEKWRIMKNIVMISSAFMIHFTAFQGAGNLQSSMNAEEGVGTASLAAVYLAFVLSNLFLPVVVIQYIGCKWTMVICLSTYIPYMGAQCYAKFFTMIPAGLLVGLGAGPLWCAKCTYLSVVAEVYSSITEVPIDTLTVRFFGIFFMIFQFSQVWGNLISSLVFTYGENRTLSSNVSEMCGKNFCPGNEAKDSNMERPSDMQILLVALIYMVCMVCACLVIAFGVDSLKRYNEGTRDSSGKGLSGFQLLVVTAKLIKERNQFILIPISIFTGMEQAFLSADFTAAYVACAWGISKIGYVMICYGIANSISALILGYLVEVTGRIPLVTSAFILNLVILISLLFWAPTPDHQIFFFVVTSLWGICDGAWLVQINAYCGILFPSKEAAAYSNYRLWQSIGFIVQYVCSSYICLNIKIYILTSVMVIGMTGYLVVECTASSMAT